MDVFNIVKSIEKLIFELLMWVVFYPYTLVRVIFQPRAMLDYARAESLKDEAFAFDSGMKPSIFLFLSIVIAAYLEPVRAAEFAATGDTVIGGYLMASPVNILIVRMVLYSLFPISFALLDDLLTPGKVTRHTLQIPFNQQCYICAPFALFNSAASVYQGHNGGLIAGGLLAAAQLWLVGANYVFFRTQSQKGRLAAVGLSLGGFALAWLVFFIVLTLALSYKTAS